MIKILSAKEVTTLKDIPNIGPAMVGILQLLNIKAPSDLKGKDPYILYARLNKKTGKRYDPCVLDVFIAAVDFMDGAAARPWWYYTKTRKTMMAKNH